MDFSKKLDFLMNITKSSNSALSLCTSLDASHISRLRRGERKLVREADYLRKMAAYFTRQCIEDYQKKALSEALGKPSDMLDDHEKTAEQIYHWLLDNDFHEKISIEGFLDNLSKIQIKASPNNQESIQPINIDLSDISLHYGDEGKKNAVIGFLSLVIESNKTDTLLLYSDEPMEWMTEDPLFLAKWAEMLKKVIAKGNKIRIIHTLNRNLDEMLEALTKWMPIYMTGAIEPYYYPKKRDGIFKRTLFIFPNTAALTSTSIDVMTDKAVNILLRDAKGIEALMAEFNAYCQLCKPLMRIFTLRDEEQYLNTLEEFEKEEANAIVVADYLSLATIPDSAVESMFVRMGSVRKNRFINYCRNRSMVFKSNLLHNHYYEVIHLPEIDEIKKGNVALGYTGIADFMDLFYTPIEFKAHLENMIQLLDTYDTYHLLLKERINHEGYALYVKEDLGAFVFKSSRSNLIFAINESNITAAFWDYLNSNLGKDKEKNKQKKETIKQLQAMINEL